MSYPASVEQVTSSRLRQKQAKNRRPQAEDDEAQYDDEVDVGVGIGGPILNFGREGAVRLESGRGDWKWTWVNQKGNEDSLIAAEGVLLYPGCRNQDMDLDDVPAFKIADSAVDYVRSLPDVSEYASISDLIMDELAAKQPKRSTENYKGSTLSVIINPKAKSARRLLAFPTGPVGCHLNISPFLPASDSKRHRPHLTTFRPSSQPAERFPTEILSICSSPFLSGSKLDREMTGLLVRLQVTTHMLNVGTHMLNVGTHPITCANDQSMAETIRVGQLNHTDTEGRRHVDMALDQTSWSRALIVDEGGGVWLWWEEKVDIKERLVKTMKVKKIRGAVSEDRHGFFRIAFGSRPGTALVMSARQLTVIDYETEIPSETVILELTGSGRVFTALESTALSRSASYTCVATNYEILWVDELATGPPVLTWRHDMGNGANRNMNLQILNGPNSEYTLLSSPDTPLLSVYDVPPSPPAQIRGAARCLALPRSISRSRILNIQSLDLGGRVRAPGADTHIVALDEAGAITSFDMGDWAADASNTMDIEDDQVMGKQHPEPIWDSSIRDIADGNTDAQSARQWTEKAKTKHKVLDLREIWSDVNRDEPDYDPAFSFQAMEQHLRERDAPLDSFVTLGDIARDAVLEEGAGRTHALLPLDVDNNAFPTDLANLTSIDLENHELHKVATLPLGLPINQSQTANDPLENIYATFAKSDMSPFTDSQARHQRDTRRLVLDLTLSRMVVHSEQLLPTDRLIRKSQEPETADNLFERTGQLTLSDSNEPGPPRVKWLAPRVDFDAQSDPQASGPPDATSLDTAASRALPNEWAVGSDPTQFIWKDWRRENSAVATPVRRPVRPLPSPRASATQTFAQSQPNPRYQAPSIAQPRPQWALHGSNSIPDILALSQGTRSSPPPVLHSSQSYQDLGASTQAERGPFGGRPDTKARKKPAKKRVGGF